VSTRGLPKVVTAEKAVEAIKSYDDVVLGNFCGEPFLLPMALMGRASGLTGVRLFHFIVNGLFQEKYLIPGMEKHIKCATAFVGRSKAVRQLIKKCRADFYPVTFGNTPRLLREGDFKSDVVMISVSPPDINGDCSLGVSVDYAWGALERPPRVVIAEVNPHMPRTCGNSLINISKIDYLVEVDKLLYEMPQVPVTDVETKIGEMVAELVEDGSTLQIGYGSLSETMIKFLGSKKDLGIHTEMVPEGIKELAAAGVVNNARKSIHKGKMIATFLAGTKKLYDWVNDNPLLEMQPVDYTNDPKVIASNYKMVSINAALQVDLFGNIYADLLGLQDQYTGSGGQPDFATGCALVPDAKFISVLPATAADGKVSRIVAHPSIEKDNILAPQIPTVPRYYADYVITEYGIAHLKGKSNRERARDLISIAHPDFKDRLVYEAKKLGLQQ
jgi:4-hydroxybutyrate CoA-transferase